MRYVFKGRPLTITLDEKLYTSPGDQPQISLTVEVVHPRAEAFITTQVHSTPAIVHTLSTICSRVTTGIDYSSFQSRISNFTSTHNLHLRTDCQKHSTSESNHSSWRRDHGCGFALSYYTGFGVPNKKALLP